MQPHPSIGVKLSAEKVEPDNKKAPVSDERRQTSSLTGVMNVVKLHHSQESCYGKESIIEEEDEGERRGNFSRASTGVKRPGMMTRCSLHPCCQRAMTART